MADKLTRVDDFGDFYAKREDLACWERPDWPSGAKVRQYIKMIEANPNAPLLVGCSAFSAMQIYIAAAAEKFDVQGIVYIPGRAKLSDATKYALSKNVEVCEVRPCPGPNVYRARARERAQQLENYVHWDFTGALTDAQFQARNVPSDVRRVLIPTGSGLIAAGVLAGLAGRKLKVVAISSSTMAHADDIIANAQKLTNKKLPNFELIRTRTRYEQYVIAQLPDKTPLDPFYAAKLIDYIRPGDLLWLTGLRPISSMPDDCKKIFRKSLDKLPGVL